jgi:hypothetical protein
MLPEASRHVQLQLRTGKVPEDGLNLLQDGHVVLLSGLLEAVVAAVGRLVVVLESILWESVSAVKKTDKA